MTLRYIFGSLFGLVLAAPTQGQMKDWPIERGPSRELVQYTVSLEAIKKAPAEYLTDYPAFYVNASTSYRIEMDGTIECTTQEVIRLNNRKGIDQIGEYRNISYTPAHEKLTLNEARVIKSERRVVDVEAKNVQLRDVATDYSVYDASKELIISFPALEVGDLIEVKWTTRGKNPEYAGQYFTRYQFGEDKYPIWHETFSAHVPTAKPLKYGLINPHLLQNPKLAPEIVEDKNGKTYIWRVSDRRPIVKEDHMPSKEELRPGVAISTFASWEAVADWERLIRVGCEDCTPELKEIVRRIKQENHEPEAMARELTHWVRSNIRYVSTGERHDFTPHEPAFVYRNRFGDCKDGVQFLQVLLKEAGIASGQVSLSPLGDGQILPEVPCPWSTHAILQVPIEGRDHWVDTTAAKAGWDFLPSSDCDRVAYIVDSKSFRLTRTPKFTPKNNRTETVTQMTFDDDGTSHNVRTVEYFGAAALQKREEWLDVSAKERRRLIRGDLLDAHSKAKLGDAIDIDALRNFDEPVRLKMRYDVPRFLHSSEDNLEGSVSDNVIWSPLLGITIDPEREAPLDLKELFESKFRSIAEAPKGFKLDDPPEDKEVKSPWGLFTVKVKADKKGRRWTIESYTRLDQTRVPKADLLKFRKFQEEIQAAFQIELTLKPLDVP